MANPDMKDLCVSYFFKASLYGGNPDFSSLLLKFNNFIDEPFKTGLSKPADFKTLPPRIP